jgi:peptide/nickel transport system ATP-binding protein
MFTAPKHPYAQALISSLPSLENKGVFQGIPGLAPSLLRVPTGCPFHPRCKQVMDICKTTVPPLANLAGDRQVACHLYTTETVSA